MCEINQRRQGKRDEKFVNIIRHSDIQNLRNGQLSVKRDEKHDKRIDKLRNDRGTGRAQPEKFLFCFLPNPEKDINVDQLADEVRRQRSGDDSRGKTEHAVEHLIRDRGNRLRRDRHINIEDDERKHDHRHSDEGYKTNSLFTVIFVDNIRNQECHGIRDDAHGHDECPFGGHTKLNQLAARQFRGEKSSYKHAA